jgi:hypothetical protein
MPRKAVEKLDGLAAAWDENTAVRARIREDQGLLNCGETGVFKARVSSVSLHHDVFRPALEITKGNPSILTTLLFSDF